MPAPPITILVVDDETELKRLIERRFSDRIQTREFQFIFALNGRSALETLKSFKDIDVVLTDLNMPDMDGLTLLKAIPKINPTLKAVVVSAYGDMTNIRAAMNRGAFDFLTKPIDFWDLTQVLHKTAALVRREREQKQQLAKAISNWQYLAHYDTTTGLPNQNAILAQIQDAIAKNSPFTLFFIHLGRLRTIEYSFGDDMAEQFLGQIIEHLQKYLEPGDFLARLWKDELALLSKGINDPNAAQRKTQKLQTELQYIGRDRYLGIANCDIGIVLSELNYRRAQDYLRAADTAMYYAKSQASQHHYAIFDPQMQITLSQRLQLESELEEAVQNQHFHLNYQPIFCLNKGEIKGFEALIRWHHPLRGIISPDRFIPITEETGLIVPLGRWILQNACAQIQQWQQQGCYQPHWYISVNLSGIQFLDPELLPYINSLLRQYQISGSCLKLEITESVLMENTATLTRLLQSLKEHQIKLSIDDFGTGYSSLAYLQSLPLDTLKIDRSFTQKMSQNAKSLDIVKTILLLARSLNLEAIAEGVETPEDVKLLQSLDCEFGQGYYFARPLPPDVATTVAIPQDFPYR
ncbi:MAG: EAL domain-containing protein [Jaaginema sp. PMC 1079.18]|nr:EAL domain-containing protein [Jaaginema sp. PMC 1080.18]MEC4850750.1 EAL domain-containing protein [Jaaginema sp. PMC 1079.18]MEC4865668.1 EAL domain-containing protein [Jaaginema sp. PMC 1078.18]